MKTATLSTALAAAMLVSACAEPTVPPYKNPAFLPEDKPTTYLSGTSYDPEALFYSFVTCETCGGPLLFEFDVNYQRSVIVGDTVAVRDGDGVTEITKAAEKSSDYGTWTTPPFASRERVFVSSDGTGTLGMGPPPDMLPPMTPPIPASTYVPTVTLRPVPAKLGACFAQEAVSLSRTGGILDALAKYMSAGGPATTVDDLLNPAKTGGVVILWMYQPSEIPLVRGPADGIKVETDKGMDAPVFFIEFAPSKDLLPPEAQPFWVPRGFVGFPGVEVTQRAGIAAIVLPPASGATTNVTIKLTDTVKDPMMARPWEPVEMTVPVAPGVASFIPQVLKLPAEAGPFPPLPYWVCYTDR